MAGEAGAKSTLKIAGTRFIAWTNFSLSIYPWDLQFFQHTLPAISPRNKLLAVVCKEDKIRENHFPSRFIRIYNWKNLVSSIWLGDKDCSQTRDIPKWTWMEGKKILQPRSEEMVIRGFIKKTIHVVYPKI